MDNSTASPKKKTPMCVINELARFNKIDNNYTLVAECGPAHQKIFKVSLELGDENHSGEGSSIKKAQQAAAATAIRKTSYKFPEEKSRSDKKDLSPTVALNSIAMKHNIQPVYSVSNNTKLNLVPNGYLYRQEVPRVMLLTLGNDVFYGYGCNEKQAKNAAANEALRAIEEGKLFNEPVDKTVDSLSPVSRLYIAAGDVKPPPIFSVPLREGPPHLPVFITKCEFGSNVVYGSGKTKRDSKQDAALNMLQKLPVDALPQISTDKKGSKKKKNSNATPNRGRQNDEEMLAVARLTAQLKDLMRPVEQVPTENSATPAEYQEEKNIMNGEQVASVLSNFELSKTEYGPSDQQNNNNAKDMFEEIENAQCHLNKTARELGITVYYMDFPATSTQSCATALNINFPNSLRINFGLKRPYLGYGSTTKIARDKAATLALKMFLLSGLISIKCGQVHNGIAKYVEIEPVQGISK